jgi:hypothetical protein
MAMLRRAVLVAVAGLAVACSSSAPPAGTIPTEAEARSFLNRVVELAQVGDFEGLCAIGDGNCMDSLEGAGRNAVPRDPPAVVGTSVIPTSATSSGRRSLGGVVLVLCGIDGHGDPYESEMLVFHDGSGLRAINPIYWGGMRIAGTPDTEETSEPVSC